MDLNRATIRPLDYKTGRPVGGLIEVGDGFNWTLAPPEYQKYTLDGCKYYGPVGLLWRLVPYPDEIQTVTVRVSVKAKPQWQASRDASLAPGECPCGIQRDLCDYHRPDLDAAQARTIPEVSWAFRPLAPAPVRQVVGKVGLANGCVATYYDDGAMDVNDPDGVLVAEGRWK